MLIQTQKNHRLSYPEHYIVYSGILFVLTTDVNKIKYINKREATRNIFIVCLDEVRVGREKKEREKRKHK